VMFTNQLNQSTNKSILRVDLLHTKSIHTPYTVSGILERSENKKSPNTFCIRAFKAGPIRLRSVATELRRTSETRTRRLLHNKKSPQGGFFIMRGRRDFPT